jgi:hypothetical protein
LFLLATLNADRAALLKRKREKVASGSELERASETNRRDKMLNNGQNAAGVFMSNNMCLVSLFIAYTVVALVYSNELFDGVALEPLVPEGAEGLPHNAGNHVYPYLASFFTCMCCTGIVMVIVCYNKIMGSIGGDAVDYTRRLRFEE